MKISELPQEVKEKALKHQREAPSPQLHYDNRNGSLYLFSEQQKLNAWEFDILKRVVRSRKKGQFKEDLEKTIEVINLYLKEYENIPAPPRNTN